MKAKLVVLLLLISSVLRAQNNGTINGTSNYSADVPTVINSYTRSLTFDQTNYVVPASPISFGTPGQAVSLGIRFNITSWGTNSSRILLSNSTQGNTYILVENSGVTIQSDEVSSSKFFPATIGLNAWHSLVITRESGYVWFYLYNNSGTLIHSMLNGYPFNGQTTFDRVGRYHTGSGGYAPFNLDGKLADLRFWNSRISDADANAYGANTTTSALPYLHWMMNDNSTTILDHQGGNSNGGTNTGSSAWITSGDNIYNDNIGSVGIGTDKIHATGYKLFVEGIIRARKLRVDAENWPDYVFDKGYKLPDLEDLEKFINLNQHLPGIPSAKEVEKNGIDVGNNQALLLKKIEELTLHIIELKKESSKLKFRLTNLENSK